jgi:BA14K-like protein
MRKFARAVLGVALAAILVISSLSPVEAIPVPKMSISNDSDVIFVQSGRRSSGRNSRPPYWHGYRGSRSQCRNCRRRNDGWWYPAAAFTTGVVVGSAAARPRTVHHVHHVSSPSPSRNSRHVSWCKNRFRSYRVSDNTFQPYSGPRRQCVSPYR